jgi:predicted dehydrogenase
MPNNPDIIRVGVVGAGANTRLHHIPKLQAIAGVEVVSVANRSRASAQRVADEFGIASVYDSWKSLIEAPDTDAIVIGTWPYMHCPVTLAALAAGKHVMCEARMALNAREARQMRDAARSHPDLIAQVVPSPFTLGVDKTVKRLLGEGYLGDLLAAEIRATSGAFADPDAPLHWRNNFDFSGYNIMTMGIWYEALMRWIGEATSVMAKGKTVIKTRRDPNTGAPAAVRIPEHLTILADMACGAQASITVSSITGQVKSNEIFLFGSEATLRLSDGVLSGAKRGSDGFSEITIPDAERGGWRVEEEFVGAIRGSEPITHTSFDDGVKYMDFTEAVTLSMTEQRAIPLPLTPY